MASKFFSQDLYFKYRVKCSIYRFQKLLVKTNFNVFNQVLLILIDYSI